MVRICVIGDPHGDLDKLGRVPRNVDFYLLTGDLGKSDLMRKIAFERAEAKSKGLPEKLISPREEKRAHLEAFNSTIEVLEYLQKFAPVYTIYGNVEQTDSETKKLSKKIGLALPLLGEEIKTFDEVTAVHNRRLDLNYLRVGFLDYFIDESWVKEFKPEDYARRLAKAKKQSEKARRTLDKFGDLDILVCHQPPYGILDQVSFKAAPKEWLGKHAGSKEVLRYIKRKQPLYVFCGHIHEGRGRAKIGNTEVYNLGQGEFKLINL